MQQKQPILTLDNIWALKHPAKHGFYLIISTILQNFPVNVIDSLCLCHQNSIIMKVFQFDAQVF